MEADASFKLAVWFQQAGNAELAQKYFERAQTLNPDDWNYHRQEWSFTGEAGKKWLEKFKGFDKELPEAADQEGRLEPNGGVAGAEGRHLAPRAFRQTGKTALRFDPDGWSRRSSLFDHPIYQRSASGFAERLCDLRSDRREAPRSAPCFVNVTV